jgi:hypothetical protein
MRPDFSPLMLKLFLRARAELRVVETGEPWRRSETLRAFKTETRKLAGITNVEFEMAWMGHLLAAAERTRLWGALGHGPADCGVILTHGGQEPC